MAVYWTGHSISLTSFAEKIFIAPVRVVPLPIWLALFIVFSSFARAQDPAVVNEPTRAKFLFRQPFELRLDATFSKFVDSMIQRDALERAIELESANRSVITKLLEYTRYLPYRVTPQVDTFFRQNYLRIDLNPSPHEGDKFFARP
jgi:hypothetical protein